MKIILTKKEYTKKTLGKRICDNCREEYFYCDSKQRYCIVCKHGKVPCKNNCGRLVGILTSKTGYCSYCERTVNAKGKTYKEIYGTSNPGCGHKKGKDNAAKKPEVRARISEGLKRNYRENPGIKKVKVESRRKSSVKNGKYPLGKLKHKNNKGKMFRSSLEVEISNLLDDNNINYEYEVVVRLNDGRIKVVDFIIKDSINDIVMEVSGYAYKAWRDDFDTKIKKLRNTIDNCVMILTYEKNIKRDCIKGLMKKDILLYSVEDKERILEGIKFCRNLNKMKEFVKNEKNNNEGNNF